VINDILVPSVREQQGRADFRPYPGKRLALEDGARLGRVATAGRKFAGCCERSADPRCESRGFDFRSEGNVLVCSSSNFLPSDTKLAASISERLDKLHHEIEDISDFDVDRAASREASIESPWRSPQILL
jgi:hypothetical protein